MQYLPRDASIKSIVYQAQTTQPRGLGLEVGLQTTTNHVYNHAILFAFSAGCPSANDRELRSGGNDWVPRTPGTYGTRSLANTYGRKHTYACLVKRDRWTVSGKATLPSSSDLTTFGQRRRSPDAGSHDQPRLAKPARLAVSSSPRHRSSNCPGRARPPVQRFRAIRPPRLTLSTRSPETKPDPI